MFVAPTDVAIPGPDSGSDGSNVGVIVGVIIGVIVVAAFVVGGVLFARSKGMGPFSKRIVVDSSAGKAYQPMELCWQSLSTDGVALIESCCVEILFFVH